MTKKRSDWEPLSFDQLQTTSLKDRPSKVRIEDFGRPWEPGKSLSDFVGRLPSILGAQEFRQAAQAISEAARTERTVLLGMGAHPSKWA